jgi:hypothetical protein
MSYLMEMIIHWRYTQIVRKRGIKIMTQVINNIYETGEWHKDFVEVTMIALKKPKATNCSDHHTCSKYSREDI